MISDNCTSEGNVIDVDHPLGSLAGETLCAFLNGQGGKAIIGVSDAGKIVGQEVSDKTRREIAAMPDRFEPPAPIEVGGRGTNRVIEECQRYGIDPPTFEEDAGFVVVTFQAPIRQVAQTTPQVGTK